MKKGNPYYYNSWLMLLTILVIALVATPASASECKIGECYVQDEWAMEPDVARRAVISLKAQRYISYQALGHQACYNQPGMPYTQGNGCLSRAINPHSTGCLMIYQCRSR